MSKPSHTGLIHLPRVKQQTDSHCGPAVIQLLFAFLRTSITQDQVVTAARAQGLIKTHGIRPAKLAKAVEKLDPNLQFWFKQHATARDLNTLIHTYHWPIGINWQGLFYDTIQEERKKNPHGEHGHYSVVVGINSLKDQVTIADPYREYSLTPRTFSFRWFKKRWWDEDSMTDSKTNKKDLIKTEKFIFIIAPKDATFPRELKMQLPEELSELQQ